MSITEEKRVVKVSVDNVAVVEELKPNHEETDTRMLVYTSYEPLYEKTVFLHMRKQRCRSASRS